MSHEAFVLLYLESEEGIPMSRIPYFCWNEETQRSYVVSARGNSFFNLCSSVFSYNHEDSQVRYFDVESGDLCRSTPKTLFHYYSELNEARRNTFWNKLRANDEYLFRVLREFEHFNRPSLNRALILIHLEETDQNALDRSLNAYLASLFEDADADCQMFKRISVGGDEVIADYLLTRFLEDKKEKADHTSGENTPLEHFDPSFDPLSKYQLRGFAPGDFSYSEDLDHLHPFEYDYDYHGYENTLPLDDFYYRFNHDPIDSIREYLRIPVEIDQILPSETRAALTNVFFDHVLSQIDSIKHQVFGMKFQRRDSSIDF